MQASLLFLFLLGFFHISVMSATSSSTSTDQVRSQSVVFLRHGVARHNFRGADLTSPTLFDPSLTYEGKLGAVQAGEKIKAWWRKTSITAATTTRAPLELIVCSPLTRTLQTATLAFGFGEDYNAARSVPLVCVENVREAFGMHYPDKRRERSVLAVRKDVSCATSVVHCLKA